MLYYYLDGLDKKGPYNPDELKSRNVTPDTLVFCDGMANWKSIKEIPDLNSLLFDKTPETETVDEIISTPIEPSVEASTIKQNVPQSGVQKPEVKKIKIPSILFLVIGFLASIGISYLLVQGQRSKDKKDLDKKVDELFQSKDEICDYQKTGVSGTLKTVTVGPDDFLGDKWISAKVGNLQLAHKPDVPDDSIGGENNIWYEQEVKKWDTYKNLVEYYKCASGGFTVQTLSKKNNGFDLVESYSKDMGFKIPASRYTPGIDYGYGISSQGYSTPTYRGTVQEAYNGAMEYLTKDKENESYVAGSYDRIKTFDEISTDFYFIGNVEPSKYSSSSVYAKSWKSSGDAYVYNTNWIVWYAYDGKHYEIVEDKKLFNKRWAIFSGIGSLIALIIYFLIRYRRKISVQVS